MKEMRVEQLRDKVIGLRPVYTDKGNATELILEAGEVKLDPRGSRSVLAALVRVYAVDLRAQRLQIQTILQRQGVLPFYLEERVFVPLKLRRAVAPNDTVYGYIDVRYLDEPQAAGKGRSRVRLKSGLELEIFSSAATAAGSRHAGLRLLEYFEDKRSGDVHERQVVDSVLHFIHGFKAIHIRLRRIEHKLDTQIAKPPGGYT